MTVADKNSHPGIVLLNKLKTNNIKMSCPLPLKSILKILTHLNEERVRMTRVLLSHKLLGKKGGRGTFRNEYFYFYKDSIIIWLQKSS